MSQASRPSGRAVSANSKKRKRRPASSPGVLPGVLLPEIPGIPAELVAVQTQCLNDTTLFLEKHSQGKPVRLYKHEQQKNEGRRVSSAQSVIAMQNESHNNTGTQHNVDEERMSQSLRQWLHTVHSSVTRDRKSSKDLIHSIMAYLVGKRSKHKKQHWTTNRAAHHMVAQLLWKSADARRWWYDHLLEWTDKVTSSRDEIWKLECWTLLHDLAESSWGASYPTLAIAAQRLEQLCPNLVTGMATMNPSKGVLSLSELRDRRDEAIEQWQTLEAVVHKGVEKAYKCIDILAPRVGNDNSKSKRVFTADLDVSGQEDCHPDDDDDDSVDWEDGCSNSGDVNIDDEQQHQLLAHAANVEKTLQAMAATGGLQEGALDIDIGGQRQDASSARQDRARVRLAKLVKRLSTKAFVRLTSWVHALLQADAMTPAHNNSNALVRFSKSQAESRRMALDRCLEMKRQILSLTTSAQRLGVEAEEQQSMRSLPSPEPAAQHDPTSLSTRAPTATRGMQRMPNPRGGAGKVRARIQIKYMKDRRK